MLVLLIHMDDFIFDKQKGFPGAFQDVIPNSEHRFCSKHLVTNFSKSFKGKALSDYFWASAKSTSVPSFGKHMDELKRLNKDAWEWLVSTMLLIALQHLLAA